MSGERAVVNYAIEWWQGNRPKDWTKEQHLDKPTVNCDGDDERRLVISVADLLRGRAAEARPNKKPVNIWGQLHGHNRF